MYEYIYQFLGANYFNKKCKISGKVKFVENGNTLSYSRSRNQNSEPIVAEALGQNGGTPQDCAQCSLYNWGRGAVRFPVS